MYRHVESAALWAEYDEMIIDLADLLYTLFSVSSQLFTDDAMVFNLLSCLWTALKLYFCQCCLIGRDFPLFRHKNKGFGLIEWLNRAV